MLADLDIVLHATGAETASGTGAAVDLQGEAGVELRRLARLRLVVTALVGAPVSLTVALDTSRDGVAWAQVDAWSALTATGSVELVTGDLERYVRVRWTLGASTTSATFAVTGTALSTCCDLTGLARLGTAGAKLATLPKATRVDHLVAASKRAAGYLTRVASSPLLSVGEDLEQAVAKLAAVSLLTDATGINPAPEATALALEEARGHLAWLRDVSRGVASATFTDSTPETAEGGGAVEVPASRGWGGAQLY